VPISISIVPDRSGVLDKDHLSIAGMIMPASLALKLDQVEDAAVVEIVGGRGVIGLIIERHLEGVLMVTFEAFEREAEFSFLKDGSHGGAAAGGRRE
jgi:hypothetical protein